MTSDAKLVRVDDLASLLRQPVSGFHNIIERLAAVGLAREVRFSARATSGRDVDQIDVMLPGQSATR